MSTTSIIEFLGSPWMLPAIWINIAAFVHHKLRLPLAGRWPESEVPHGSTRRLLQTRAATWLICLLFAIPAYFGWIWLAARALARSYELPQG